MVEHITTDSIESALTRVDADTDALQRALADVQASLEEYWGEWMDLVEDGSVEVVAEGHDVLVLADHTGHNWDEELAATVDDAVIQRAVTQAHHEEAERRAPEYDWSVADAFVVAITPGIDEGQLLVEAIVNSLMRRGLSPGQAWAYYGVRIRGHSRNGWAKRCGYSDHSAVSEPLRKAEEKLS